MVLWELELKIESWRRSVRSTVVHRRKRRFKGSETFGVARGKVWAYSVNDLPLDPCVKRAAPPIRSVNGKPPYGLIVR